MLCTKHSTWYITCAANPGIGRSVSVFNTLGAPSRVSCHTPPCSLQSGCTASVLNPPPRPLDRNPLQRSLPSQSPGLALGPLLTCLGAFGGNVLACLVLGTRNMVLTEEIIWSAAVAAWVLVGGRFVRCQRMHCCWWCWSLRCCCQFGAYLALLFCSSYQYITGNIYLLLFTALSRPSML